MKKSEMNYYNRYFKTNWDNIKRLEKTLKIKTLLERYKIYFKYTQPTEIPNIFKSF